MTFRVSPLNSIAVAIATFLAALSLRNLFDAPLPMTDLAILVAIPGLLGAAASLLRIPQVITWLLQAAGLSAFLLWQATLLAPENNSMLGALVHLVDDGAANIQTNPAPLPLTVGSMWLAWASVALAQWLCELLVNSLEQPAWAIAPLGVLYGVPAIAVLEELDLKYFVLLAVGYGLILLVSTGFASHRALKASESIRLGASRALAAALTLALAIGLSVMVSEQVPLADKQLWNDRESREPIELSDPTVALNENLLRPDERPVLRYVTSDDQPTYLRTVALTLLTSDGARLTPMQLATRGLSNAYEAPGTGVDIDVTMNFGSEYLPVPFAVDSFEAEGDWGYDPPTLSVIATGPDRFNQTTQLSYSASAVRPDPSSEQLAAAKAGADPSGGDNLSVPEGLAPGVRELVDEITAGATTDGERAVAIQTFLRSEAFSYSLSAPQTVGMDTLSTFLLQDRQGYCIHFTAAMVAMARIKNIPARMAIGFTPGEPHPDGGFQVTTHNMHSWPELYFEGLGWVPFEPTASVASPPSYTPPDQTTDASPSPEPSESPSPSSEPSEEPSPAEPSPEPSQEEEEEGTATDGGDQEETNSTVIVVLLSVLGLLALLALPALIRTGLRAWRLRDGQDPDQAARSAWREMQATMLDARKGWEAGSPIGAANTMSQQVGPHTAPLLSTVAEGVERTLYSRQPVDPQQLLGAVQTTRSAVQAELGNKRWLATLLPASLWRM